MRENLRRKLLFSLSIWFLACTESNSLVLQETLWKFRSIPIEICFPDKNRGSPDGCRSDNLFSADQMKVVTDTLNQLCTSFADRKILSLFPRQRVGPDGKTTIVAPKPYILIKLDKAANNTEIGGSADVPKEEQDRVLTVSVSAGNFADKDDYTKATRALVHEIFHALGAMHEQKSPLRDKYVAIEYQSLRIPTYAKEQYSKGCVQRDASSCAKSNLVRANSQYDFKSALHYPLIKWKDISMTATAFAGGGEEELRRINFRKSQVGNWSTGSEIDMKSIQDFYQRFVPRVTRNGSEPPPCKFDSQAQAIIKVND